MRGWADVGACSAPAWGDDPPHLRRTAHGARGARLARSLLVTFVLLPCQLNDLLVFVYFLKAKEERTVI